MASSHSSGLTDAAPSTLRLQFDGAVATVSFNRPERRNGVIPMMVEELHRVLAAIAREPDIHVVVLTGEGKTFCPGGDLLPREPGAEAEVLPSAEAFHSATLLQEMPQITVAAINGACGGAGLCWAAACDVRVAAEGARFTTAFLQLGLSGELGIAWTLPRLIGEAAAKELMLFPEPFDAVRAHELGFVTRVFNDDDFPVEVRNLVRELREREPEALRAIKSNVARARNLSLRDFVDFETPEHLAAFAGDRQRLLLEKFGRQTS